MADADEHLPFEDASGGAAVRTHEHLVSACPECGESWQELGPVLREVYREQLARAVPPAAPAPPRPDDLSGAPAAVDGLATQAARLRRLRRRAKKQLSELRTLPARRRAARVRGAYRRFRTRWLAELLIEECRARVRDDPAEAESFASLVPLVLDWTRGSDGPEWARPLLARAEAHRANALRVAGDLPAAERVFEDLGRRLGERPITETAAVGEIVSLEASLRIDQRQAQRADELLATAALAFEYVNDRAGLARTWIKRANLLQALDQPEDVLTLLDEAASLLATNSTPYLTICTVTGRVTSLCDLNRPAEARQLLRRNLDAFEADEGPHAAALLRFLEGRVSLELGEYVAAQEYFASCIDGMLTVGRAYDAALAALYLGETFYLQGRNRELRALAARLLPEFSSRGVARETIAVLQLFSRAVGEEGVTSALLRKLRRRLSASQVRSPATSL